MKKKFNRILAFVCVFAMALSSFALACSYDPVAYIQQKNDAHDIAEAARAMGLPESDPIITRAQQLWWEAENQFNADRDIIACVIYNEAWGGCTDRHRELVGAVVYNRVHRYQQSVYDVVTAPGQYLKAYATPGSFYWNKATADPEVWKHCQEIATKVLNGEVDCPSDVLFQAEGTQGTGTYEICKTYYSTTYFCYG